MYNKQQLKKCRKEKKILFKQKRNSRTSKRRDVQCISRRIKNQIKKKNQINNNNKLQRYKVSTLDTMKKPKAKGFTKYCTVRKHRGQLIRCRNQSRKKSIDVKKKSKRDKVHCKNKNTKSQTYFISVFIKIITSCDIVLCQTTKNIQPLGCKLDI